MGRTTKEDYARHYRDYQGTPEQIKKRTQRNAARAEVVKRQGKSAVEGKDVDHKKRLAHGGGNGPKNLRIRSKAANRGWR
jgi:hypothetical protein